MYMYMYMFGEKLESVTQITPYNKNNQRGSLLYFRDKRDFVSGGAAAGVAGK